MKTKEGEDMQKTVYKKHLLTIDISARTRQVIPTNTTFWTMDVETGKLKINFVSKNQPVNLTGTTVLLGFYFENGGSKLVDSKEGSVVIDDVQKGRCHVTMPSYLFNYSGSVLIHVYILYDDGKKLDCATVATDFERSWLDQELPEMEAYYVKRIEDWLAEIEIQTNEIKKDLESRLTNLRQEMISVQNQVQTIETQIAENNIVRQEEFDNLSATSRNVLKNSRIINLLANNNTTRPHSRETLTEAGITFLRIRNTGNGTIRDEISAYNALPFNQITENLGGKIVTLSHKVRFSSHIQQTFPIMCSLYGGAGAVGLPFDNMMAPNLCLDDRGWQTIAVTFQMPKFINEHTGIRFLVIGGVFDESDVNEAYIDYRDWSITLADDKWTPAPEDTFEIGGRNLLLDSNNIKLFQSFQGSQLIFEEDVEVEEWRATDATRVKTKDGSHQLKMVRTYQTPSLNNQSYITSVWIKNEGSHQVNVWGNLTSSGDRVVNPGEARRVVLRSTGNGVSHAQLQIRTDDPNHNLQFIMWRPKAEYGSKATDWTPAPEDLDFRDIAQMQKITQDDGTPLITVESNENVEEKVVQYGSGVYSINIAPGALGRPPGFEIGNLRGITVNQRSNGQGFILLRAGSQGRELVVGTLNNGILAWSEIPIGNLSVFDANVTRADQLVTERKITLTGDVTGTADFDGSSNIKINTTLTNRQFVEKMHQEIAKVNDLQKELEKLKVALRNLGIDYNNII